MSRQAQAASTAAEAPKATGPAVTEVSKPTDTPEPTEAPTPESTDTPESLPAVTMEFDTHMYPNTNDDNYYEGLAYASNSSDKPTMASFNYIVYDKDGNVMSVYDMYRDRYKEKFSMDVFIPAGAKDFPIWFILTLRLIYDLKKGENMP